MKLYSYWRSSASYRVRIALNLKQLDYEYIPVHLVKDGGQQHFDEYVEKNPSHLVPTLFDDEQGITLNQSLAIIEYLDEQYPETLKLLPSDIKEKMLVKTIAFDIACDVQPVGNLRVLQYLVNDLSQSDDAKVKWARHWIDKGFSAIERRLQQSAGLYCVGDNISMADVVLVPQAYNAERFGIELNRYPKIEKIVNTCNTLEAFKKAMPEQQPDAVVS